MSCSLKQHCEADPGFAAVTKLTLPIACLLSVIFSFSLYAQSTEAQTEEPEVSFIEMILSTIVELENNENRQAIADITFTDSDLGACVNNTAALFSLTFADEMTNLNCDDENIGSLDGLAHFTSLTDLSLNNNPIADYSPLSSLSALETLSLGNTGMTALFDMSGLSNLNSLSVWNNDLTTIAPAADLSAITHLDLSENNIANLGPLRRLTTLTVLNISQNRVVNLAPIQNLNALTRLEAWQNDIVNIQRLENLTALTYLDLFDNQIVDITVLGGLTALTYLDLYGNSIVDISALTTLSNLTVLDLGENQVADISGLAALTTLQELTLFDNPLSDISGLSGLTALYYLDVGSTGIDDISALSGLTNLQTLYLDGNNITDISSLSAMVLLERLFLEDNQIEDISALRGLINLTTLQLAGNDNIDCVDVDDPLSYADIPSECIALEPGALLQGELFMLPDVNQDGLNDVGIFVLDAATGEPTLQVLSAFDLSSIKVLTWPAIFSEASLMLLPDVNGNDMDEVGVYGIRNDAGFEGRGRLLVYDLLTESVVKNYNWPASWSDTKATVLSDVNGDGVDEVGIQGRSRNSNRPQFVVRNGDSAGSLFTFSFPDIFSSFDYVQLSDLTGDGVDDVGLMGIRSNNGRLQIRTVDGTDPGNRLSAYNFGNKWADTQWVRLSDANGDGVDDWGLFGRRVSDDRYQVIGKSGATTRGVLQIHTWASDYGDVKFMKVPDMTGDGVDELAVSGLRSNNRYLITVKDGADRSVVIGNWGWPSNWSEVSLEMIADQNDDGLVEFAIFGQNTASEWEIVIKDGDTRLETKRYNLGSDWLTKPKLMFNDSNFDGVEDVVLYGQDASNQPKMQVWNGAGENLLY